MSNFPKVAIWSSEFDSLDGQSIVTSAVVGTFECFRSKEFHFIYSSGASVNSVINWILLSARIWWTRVGGKLECVYIVCSRSTSGFIRDLPALLLALSGTKVTVHAHGSDLVSLLDNGIASKIARMLYRKCYVIVPSSHMVEQLASLKINAYVCENFVDDGLVSQRLEARRPSKKLRILWNSNLVAGKGFPELFEAVKQENSGDEKFELTVLGRVIDDPWMSGREINSLIDGLSHYEWFDFRGAIPAKGAANLVNVSDVVALPSRYPSECQPLAIINAMCGGCAVVIAGSPALRATTSGYPANELQDVTVDEVRRALNKIYQQQQFDTDFWKSRERAALLARARFSFSNFENRMSQIFEMAFGSADGP